MNRRRFASSYLLLLGVPGLFAHHTASAQSLVNLSNTEATQGLKAVLEKGVGTAIKTLGQVNGFFGNDQVRIPLPGYLQDVAEIMRSLGQGARLDELVVAMNRAAETAVPLARDMLVNAVKGMNVQDAKNILSGGETAVTEFFAEKTRRPLAQKFLPVVTETTARVDLAAKYNQIAGKAASMGLVKGEQSTIEQYVTAKTLDGLYFMIGEEERKIRQDPVSAGSAVLKKVFGALKP